MKVRRQNLFILPLVLVLGAWLLRVDHASAQAGDFVRVVPLSSSGYERGNSLAFSSDGKYLAVGGLSGIYLFNFQQLSDPEYIETNAWARSVAFLPGSDTLAAGLFDGTVKFWEVPNTNLFRMLDGHKGWVRSISVSGDGSLIASASDDDTLRVWEAGEGTSILVIEKVTGIRAVALSLDGNLVAGALGDNTVRVWSLPDGNLMHTLAGHEDWVRCLDFSPDGSMLASGSFDKTIRLWNIEDGSELRALEGHTSSILGIAFSPDGKALASGSVDQTVRLWQVDTGETLQILDGHTDFVYSVAFSPDGHSLASGGGDNAIRIWDLDALAASPSRASTSADQGGTSDCRACHHRRGQIEPARVIELSCEGCHAGGAGLSWCAAFPRMGTPEPISTGYQAVREVSGVPVGGREVAVVIASLSNGETLYVGGNYQVPEAISGRVFYAAEESITKVRVQLDILSNVGTTAYLATYPSGSGEFSFPVEINPNSPAAHGPDLFCRACHGRASLGSGLPGGNVRIVVTATAPDGTQAFDERWIRVDSSREAALPVQVIDDVTGEPIPGLSIQASTVLYAWRARIAGATSDAEGDIQLSLESLSQAPTVYQVNVPSQVVNGLLYTSDETVQVSLEPGRTFYPAVTLTAHAQAGKLSGKLEGEELPAVLEGTKLYAVRVPAGPAYQASLASDNAFSFEEIPIDQYLVFADPIALAGQGLSASAQQPDLLKSPQAATSLELTKVHYIFGRVTARDGTALPFAWITAGENARAVPVNPVSGEYLLSDLPVDAAYLTVSAPGYYSHSLPADTVSGRLDFQLVPRPETTRIPWEEGEIILSSDAVLSINDLDIGLERGWIWGSGGGAQPLWIHLPGLEVNVSGGEFALESSAGGMAWLYLYNGQAEVIFDGSEDPIQLNTGEMIALAEGAQPMPMDRSLAAGLHPALGGAPIPEVIEPSLKALLENRLVKAGISVARVFTLIAYILSLAVLVCIPLYAVIRAVKQRRDISDPREHP